MKNILRKFIPRTERTYFPHPDPIKYSEYTVYGGKMQVKNRFLRFFFNPSHYLNLSANRRAKRLGYLGLLARMAGFCPR